MGFNHLHVHSHYSIGRALPSVESLVERAAALGMKALALTDNNSIAGMGELYQHCSEKNISPILGCEIDILPSNHGMYHGRTHRLVVLVENQTGYRNIVQILSRAHQRPDGVPPHVTFTDFERYSEGLIILSGSRRSELYHWLREKQPEQTKNYLTRLIQQVGKANLFFEIIEYPHPRTRKIMDQILELSNYFDIPAVATQNVHFLDPEHMMAYCALVQHPHLLAPQWPPPESELPTRHFTTQQEMEKRFSYHPELMEATEYIAQRCEFQFPRRRDRVPTPVFERGQDAAAALWDRAIIGAGNRYGGVSQAVRDRISEEYSDLVNPGGNGTDLAGFLLLLSEMTESLRHAGACQGVGRGKLLTSVVAYSIGLTEVDPLEHNLPYQSIRPEDALLPLVELDVSSQTMEIALRWLGEQVGKPNVVGVGHRVDWERQPLFHHLLKWANLPPAPLRIYSAPDPIIPTVNAEEVLDEEIPMWRERFPTAWDEEVEPASGAAAGHAAWVHDPRIPREMNIMTPEAMAEVAYTLHPCPRGFDMLRGQYAVSKEPIDWAVPIIPSPSGNNVTQADGKVLDRLSIPRVQFGSFSTLNVLEMAQDLIRQNDNGNFSLQDIPTNDEKAFKLLGHGLTNGVAALHNITAKSLLRSEAVNSISELLNVHVMARRRRHDPPPTGSVDERVKLQTSGMPATMQSYWCAYLKAHYPVSFMAAMLTHSLSTRSSRAGQRPRFQVLLREARRMGLTVLGPDINYSSLQFSQEHERIRTGLMVIQGLGEKIFAEIERERQAQPFSTLTDFCQRTDPRMVPQAVVVNLIKAGAFDSLDPDRPELLIEFERTLKNTRLKSTTSRESKEDKQLQLFDSAMFEEEITPPPPDEDEEDVAIPRQKIIRYEQEAVGYSITFDLLDYYNSLMRTMGAVLPHEIARCRDGDEIFVAGFIDHVEYDGLLIEEDGQAIVDLEGYVVKLPAELARRTGKLQKTRSPVLVDGEVQDHLGREKFLRAKSLHLLEDVASRAAAVKEIHLDLPEHDGRRLSALRGLLKRYKGKTIIRLAEQENTKRSWWKTRGIDGARVFFCPPLLNRLLEILPETRIKVLDNSGRRLPLNFVGK